MNKQKTNKKQNIIANMILKEKNKVGGLKIFNFKTQYKTMVIQIRGYCQRAENSQVNFGKRARAIQWNKEHLQKIIKQLNKYMQKIIQTQTSYPSEILTQSGSQAEM